MHPRTSSQLITRDQLVTELTQLGVADASVVMPHVSMSSIGWIIGGAQTLVEALLQSTHGGTILALTGWDDRPPYHQHDWPAAARAAHLDACPAFDPLKAHAERSFGRFAEAVRTWPGASHSPHPVDAFAAIGPHASSLTANQSLDEGYGKGSPLEGLVEVDGSVLLLGSPLEHTTLLHYAEYLVDAPEKRWNEYEMPILVDDRRVWRRIRELESSLGAFRYEDLNLGADAFELIVRDALAQGIGRSGHVGAALSHLLPARG